MDEYRKLAQQKYLKHIQNKTELEEFNNIKIKMDNEYEILTFNLIQNSIKSIEENININNDIDNDVVILMETFCDNFDFFEKRNQLNRLKEIVIKFVDTINFITQSKKINLRNINLLTNNFNIIFDMLGLDITIEKMDTSEDEIYARQMQEQIYQNEFNKLDMNQFNMNDINEFIENELSDHSDIEYNPDDE